MRWKQLLVLLAVVLLFGSACVALVKPSAPQGGWFGAEYHVVDVPIAVSYVVALEHADTSVFPDVVLCWRDGSGAPEAPGCASEPNPGIGLHQTEVGRPTGYGEHVLTAAACTASGDQCDQAQPSSDVYQVPLNFKSASIVVWSTRSWSAYNNPNYFYSYDYNAYPVSDSANPTPLRFLADSNGPFDEKVCVERAGEADRCHVVHANGSTSGEILYNPSVPGTATIRATNCVIIPGTFNCAINWLFNESSTTAYFYDIGQSGILADEYPATLGSPVAFDAVLDASVATSAQLRACLAYPEVQTDIFFCTETSPNPGPGTHTFVTPARLGPADRIELQACSVPCDRYFLVDTADLIYQ